MILHLHDDNERKFDEIFHTYKDKLYGYLLGLTHNEQQAEDALQNVFMRLWQNREQLNDVDNVNAYLFRMAQNDIIDASRKFVRRQRFLSEAFTDDVSANNPLKDILSAEVENKFKEAVDQLTEQQRRVFLMRREQGMSHADIARQLGISTETSESTMKRALKSMRTYLTVHYPELWLLIMTIPIGTTNQIVINNKFHHINNI